MTSTAIRYSTSSFDCCQKRKEKQNKLNSTELD